MKYTLILNYEEKLLMKSVPAKGHAIEPGMHVSFIKLHALTKSKEECDYNNV